MELTLLLPFEHRQLPTVTGGMPLSKEDLAELILGETDPSGNDIFLLIACQTISNIWPSSLPRRIGILYF